MFFLYGLTIATAVFVGFCLSRRRASKFGIKPCDIESLFLICVPFAIIGARLYHIFSQISYYQKNPHEVFYFWQGGWGVYGAIAGGIIAVFFYARFTKINFWKILNLLTPGLVLGQAIGRIGNIVNGELLPYSIYESILDSAIFLFFTFNFSLTPARLFGGTFHFSTYAILYGAGRFFLEFLRKEPELFLGLKLNQAVSLLFVGFGIIARFAIIQSSKFKVQNCNSKLKVLKNNFEL